MLKVYKECCKNCLLTKDRIVSPTRAKQILNKCAMEQTHFICHKASLRDEEVVCHSFYNQLGYRSQMIRIYERIGAIEFVEQPDGDKLPTYTEMKSTPLNKK